MKKSEKRKALLVQTKEKIFEQCKNQWYNLRPILGNAN